MKWQLEYLLEAVKDLKRLDGSERILVTKAIKKVLDDRAC
jgi:mRNA interferase RelE/StbE